MDDDNNVRPMKRVKLDISNSVETNAILACDIVINQMTGRFSNSGIFTSFTVIDPKQFSIHKQNFPKDHICNIKSNYSIINKEKLSSELTVIYENETFSDIPNVSKFMSFLQDNDLITTFPEVSKLLEIVLVTPVSTAEAERCFSTLKRIKTFLRNSMVQDRLNALAFLSVHKEYVTEITQFKQKIIEMFVKQKNRRAEYMHK